MADRAAPAMRAAAEGQREHDQGGKGGDGAEAPVLRFRNYAPAGEDTLPHEKVAPAEVPEFAEVRVDVDAALGDDPEEVLIDVAPKKANWDLRRDIAGKLTKLERRTQAAMIKLMQQEEARRQQEEQAAE